MAHVLQSIGSNHMVAAGAAGAVVLPSCDKTSCSGGGLVTHVCDMFVGFTAVSCCGSSGVA